jgi:hypothetical protein
MPGLLKSVSMEIWRSDAVVTPADCSWPSDNAVVAPLDPPALPSLCYFLFGDLVLRSFWPDVKFPNIEIPTRENGARVFVSGTSQPSRCTPSVWKVIRTELPFVSVCFVIIP